MSANGSSPDGTANGPSEKRDLGPGDPADVPVQPPNDALPDALHAMPPAKAQVPTIVHPAPVRANGTATGKDVEAGRRSPSPAAPRTEAGLQPDAVYAASLAPWRDNFRKWCVRRLRYESEKIGQWQTTVRTPARDSFFFYSAIFGSESPTTGTGGMTAFQAPKESRRSQSSKLTP